MEVEGITYKDLPRDLKDHSTYLRLDHPLVVRAMLVARNLDLFIEAHYQSTYMLASVTMSAATLSVEIGDVCVWDSENFSEDTLTFEQCLAEYKTYIAGLNEIFAEPPAEPADENAAV